MTSIVYLTNKKNGKVYAYINEKVYDKPSGKYVYRRRCIGHVNPDTGTIDENRPKERKDSPSVISVGTDMYLRRIADECGLSQSLRIAFPKDWTLILTCAMYLIAEKAPLSQMTPWTESNRTPYGEPVTVGTIETLLSEIDSEAEEAFMRIWRKRVPDKEIVTVVTNYERYSEKDSSGSIVITGMQNVPSEVVMCYGRESRIPLCYAMNATPTFDLTSISETLERLYWIRGEDSILVTDREYGTYANSEFVKNDVDGFLMILPNTDRNVKESIAAVKDTIVDSSNYYSLPNGSHGFVTTKKIFGRHPYVQHLYYNEEDEERDMGVFFTLVEICQRELEQNIIIPAHMPLYTRFFNMGAGTALARKEVNSNKVMDYASSAGYMAMISDIVTDPTEAMWWKYKMNQCSNLFTNIKNAQDSPRLKLFSEHNIEARTFIQFIAYILHSAVLKNLEDGSLTREFTVQSAVREMSGIMQISDGTYKRPRMTKSNYRQDILMRNAGITN